MSWCTIQLDVAEIFEFCRKVTGQVDYVSWRNKFTGWHDSWSIAVNGAKTQLNEVSWHDSYDLLIREKKSLYNSRYSQGDAFYKLF